MIDKAITIYQAPGRRGHGSNAGGFTKAFIIKPGDVATLAAAVAFDNCPARYADGYRTGKNFISADCILKDIDNKHSNDPADWITPEDVAAAFPGVAMYQYPSRNNMKDKTDAKTGKAESARPRFHNIMPIEPITEIRPSTFP